MLIVTQKLQSNYCQHFYHDIEYAADLPGLYLLFGVHFFPIRHGNYEAEEFPLLRNITKSHGKCSFSVNNDLGGRRGKLALQIQALMTEQGN